jgi:hypothetical protein
MKSLLTPAIWIVAVAILLHTGLLTPSAAFITFALYAAFIAGLLIAWRFHSSRIFFALLVLFLAERAISYFSSGHVASGGPGSTALAAVGVVLPLNFVLLSLAQEKGFTFSNIGGGCGALPTGCAGETCVASFASSAALTFRHADHFRTRGGCTAYSIPAFPQTSGEWTPLGHGRFILGTPLRWRWAHSRRLLRHRCVHSGSVHGGNFLPACVSR